MFDSAVFSDPTMVEDFEWDYLLGLYRAKMTNYFFGLDMSDAIPEATTVEELRELVLANW